MFRPTPGSAEDNQALVDQGRDRVRDATETELEDVPETEEQKSATDPAYDPDVDTAG